MNGVGGCASGLLYCVLAHVIMAGGAVTFTAIGRCGLLAQLIMEGGAAAFCAMGQCDPVPQARNEGWGCGHLRYGAVRPSGPSTKWRLTHSGLKLCWVVETSRCCAEPPPTALGCMDGLLWCWETWLSLAREKNSSRPSNSL